MGWGPLKTPASVHQGIDWLLGEDCSHSIELCCTQS